MKLEKIYTIVTTWLLLQTSLVKVIIASSALRTRNKRQSRYYDTFVPFKSNARAYKKVF